MPCSRYSIGPRGVVAVAFALAAVGATPAAAQSPDALRGQRIYETACTRCHQESVHGRRQKSVTNYEEIRTYVRRWSSVAAPTWTDEDISDVVQYLNERYYRFVCPAITCRPERTGPETLPHAMRQ